MPSRIEKALINRDYARIWAGQALSTVGDFVFDTTLALWIVTKLAAGKSWAPAAMAGVLITAGVAAMVVGPLAGVFVDRWNRRRTMLRTELIRAALVGVLAALTLLPDHALPVGLWLAVIYVVVFGVNAASCFFNPSRNATISDLVPDEADRAKASGLGQATTATAAIIGPPLAAPFLFLAGFQWAIFINALSYLWSYSAIRSVRTPDTSGGGERGASNFRAEFVDGLRYFRGNRVLMAVCLIAVIASLGTGAWNTLEIFFVTGNLHADRKLFGLVGMAMGAGMIVGSLLASRVVRKIGAKATVWLTIGVAGFLIMAYSRQTHFAAALVIVFVVAVPIAMVNTAIGPIIFGAAKQEYMGRVFAVFVPVIEFAGLLSAVLAGVLLSSVMRDFHMTFADVHFGPVDSIFTMVGILFVAAGGYGLFALPKDSRGAAADTEDEGRMTVVAEPAV